MVLITCPDCGKQISDKARSCPGCGVPSDAPVNFECVNLKNVIRKAAPPRRLARVREFLAYFVEGTVLDNYPVTRADLNSLEELNVGDYIGLIPLSSRTLSRGIADLTGLEHANRLSKLFLSTVITTSHISDLSPLARLTSLKVLDLDYNKITDISPLAGLT